MVLCDTHTHLLAPEWLDPVADRIGLARRLGIGLLLQPGVRESDWPELLGLAEEYDEVYAAPGLHPMCAAGWSIASAAELRVLCSHTKVIAIGEVGLDALLDVDMARQREAFVDQVNIACEAKLPLLIHCRKRTNEVLEILQKFAARLNGGIWHGFSGSCETAQRIIKLGFTLGIGPVLLRDNVRRLPAALETVPDEMLVLETDAPDMATGPEALLAVAQRLAAIRGWTEEECARQTTANAKRILQLGDLIGE